MKINKLIQEKLKNWFDTNDFTTFINYLKDTESSVLDFFYKYNKQFIFNKNFQQNIINDIKNTISISDYELNSIDWNYNFRCFIGKYKTDIYNKFKEYAINRNFLDYYESYDHTEFDNLIEREFIKFYKKEIPNMTVADKDLFLLGNPLGLDECCFNLIKNQYQSYNKYEVILIIRHLIQQYVQKYKADIEKIQSKSAKKLNKFCKDLIKAIKKDLNTFVLKVKFAKEKNGSYTFSWDDTNWNGNSRNDAIGIIKYVSNHKSLMQQLVPDVNIKQLEKDCDVNLTNYFLEYYRNNYDESLQQLARKYIFELQKEIVNKRAWQLENKKDDNKLGKLSTFNLNYDITNDCERSCPALICTNGKRSFILTGNFGEAHSTLKARCDKRLYKLENKKICYAYILGRMLFTTDLLLRTCNFSQDEVISIMKKDGRFSKFYLIPNFNRKKVIRLAKRIK